MRSGFLESGVADGIHVNHRSAYFITLFLVIAAYAIIGQIPLSIVIATNPDALEAYKFGNTSGLGLILGKNKFLLFLILPFVFSLLALLLSVRFIHEWPIRSLFTAAHRFDWKRFFLSCPALANHEKIRDKIQFKKLRPNGEVVQSLILNGSKN